MMQSLDSSAPEAPSEVPTAAWQHSPQEEPLSTHLTAAAAAAEEQACLLSIAIAHVFPPFCWPQVREAC